MSDNSLTSKAFSGVFWKFAERICAQLVTTVVSIVLARILMPEDYASISIVSIFFAFANIFISGGLNTALIQKKDSDDLDYSTILIGNIIVSCVLYVTMFFSAPLIAKWYEQSILMPVIRVMALTFFINSFKSVVCAKVSNELKFRKFFFSTIIGTVISAFVGIIMAVNGFGPWALVAQQMTNSVIDTIVLTVTTKFHLHLRFSITRFKPLFRFGGKLMLAAFIDTTYEECRPLIIGLKFSGTDLAFYNKGKTFPQLVNSTVSDTLSSVLFPVMTKAQDSKEQMRAMTRRFIRVCSYVIFPCLLGLFAIADNFIKILLTDKWLECVPFLRIFCITHMLNIVQNGNLQPIRAIGRSDVLLKLDIMKKSVYFVVLSIFILIAKEPLTLAYMGLFTSLFAAFVNTTANRKLFDYHLKEQIWDIVQNLIPSAIMCVIVLFIGKLHINMYVLIILQILVGVVTYMLFSIVFKNSSFYYLLDFVKNIISKKEKHSK